MNEENVELAKGLPASRLKQVDEKNRLASLFEQCVAEAVGKTANLNVQDRVLREQLMERILKLRVAMDEKRLVAAERAPQAVLAEHDDSIHHGTPRGDPVLDVPRRRSPRTRIPAGAVALAGRFSGVYPQASPGGWQLIGTTKVPMWDLSRDPPALLAGARNAYGLVGSVQFRGGNIIGLNERLRVSEQFMLGGNLIRGFENRGIGPRDATSDDAIGGRWYFAATTEAQFPIPGIPKELGLGGALFADAGSLWDADNELVDIVEAGGGRILSNGFDLRASVGFGIRWQSPFGPLKADFAYPLLKEDSDRTQVFRLSGGTTF